MSNYGLAFDIEMHDSEDGFAERRVLTMPGDYIRMSEWADRNMAEAESDAVNTLRRNYATAWHALKRRGKLEEFGLPDELTVEAIDAMADRYTVYVHDLEEGALPLAGEPAR